MKMKKFSIFLQIVIAFFAVYSCIPGNANLVDPSISGPRIITKIDSSNVMKQEFISNNSGVLQQVKFSSGEYQNISYNGNNKISKITSYEGTTIEAEWQLSYDANNRLYKVEQTDYLNSAFHSFIEYLYTYNSANQITHIDSITSFALGGGTGSFYGVIDYTYSGNNIVKAVENSNAIINGVPEPLDPITEKSIIFENFDGKINPMSTLPKEYLIFISSPSIFTSSILSASNSLKNTIYAGGTNSTSTSTGFNYDLQNYPISDVSGVVKYHYKAIQ